MALQLSICYGANVGGMATLIGSYNNMLLRMTMEGTPLFKLGQTWKLCKQTAPDRFLSWRTFLVSITENMRHFERQITLDP